MWALVNTQYVVSSNRTVLPAVIAVLLIGLALVPLAPSFWGRLHQLARVGGILLLRASSLMYSAPVIAIVCAVRIQEPGPAPSISA